MKKISMFLLLSFVILTVNAQIPKNLGDFTLGSSLNSVEKTLASMGLEETEIGMMDRGKYAFDEGIVLADGGEMLTVSFPAADPFSCFGEDWDHAELYFYQKKLYKIELYNGYWGEGFESGPAVNVCRNTYNDVKKNLDAKYAKFKNKKDFSNEGEVNFTKYNSGNLAMEIRLMNFEYEGVEVRLILKDDVINKKAEDVKL